MSVVVERSNQIGLSPSVCRLRAHAAVVRSLLDELDRAAPSSGLGPQEATVSCHAEYLAEELAHLARRITECAEVAAFLAASLFAGHRLDASSSTSSGTESTPTKVAELYKRDERGENRQDARVAK
jgi:hypothetical protein